MARQLSDADPVKARECFRKVMATATHLMTEEDFLTYGFACEDDDDFQVAKKVYESLTLEFPQSFRGFYALGVVNEELENLEEAELAYLKAIELKEDFVEAYFFLAGVYDDMDQDKKAESNYLKTVELEDDHFFGWLNLGSIYEGQNKNEKAKACFEKALSIEEHYMAYFNLGVVASKNKTYEEAIVLYEKSIGLNPEYGYAYLNLALVYKAKDQYLQGIKVLNRGIQETEDVSYLFYHRACFYVHLGITDKAMKDVKEAIRLHPGFEKYMLKDKELSLIHDLIKKLEV